MESRPLLSVVLPSIKGREYSLSRALASFRETTQDYETIIVMDKPTCGVAWNEAIPQAQGDYILLAADDLEAHDGWFQAGREALDRGVIPCPRILNPDGSLQSCGTYDKEAPNGTPSVVARVPFIARRMVETLYPIFENQYMGDHWITWKAQHWGWPTLVVREMLFTHHFAMEGRIDSLTSDVKAYHRATK